MNRYSYFFFFFLVILILSGFGLGAAEEPSANSVSGLEPSSILSDKTESAPGWMAPWTGSAAAEGAGAVRDRKSPSHYPWYSPKARLSDYPMAGTKNSSQKLQNANFMAPWSNQSEKNDAQIREEADVSLTRGVLRGSGEENPFWSRLPISEKEMEEGVEVVEPIIEDSLMTQSEFADSNDNSMIFDISLSPTLINPTALLNGNPVLSNNRPFFEPFQLGQNEEEQENGALTGIGQFRVEAKTFLFGQKTATVQNLTGSEGAVSFIEDRSRISLPGENLGWIESGDNSLGRGMVVPSQFGQSLFQIRSSNLDGKTNSSLFQLHNTIPPNTANDGANWFIPSSAGGSVTRDLKPEDRAWFRP